MKFPYTISVFLILAVTLTASQQCQTLKTPHGTIRPERCLFPFIYKGRRYLSCTRDFDPNNRLWCSVEVDHRGFHVIGRGRWGYCNQLCSFTQRTFNQAQSNNFAFLTRTPTSTRRPTTRWTTTITTTTTTTTSIATIASSPSLICVTVSGSTPNKPCVFPFIYQGRAYSECLADDTFPELKWCSTKVDHNGNHVPGNWGHCSCKSLVGCPNDDFRSLTDDNQDGSVLPAATDSRFRCGLARLQKEKSTFIIGGVTSKLAEFPFAVLLQYILSNGRPGFLCGGTLLNRRYVLTAAHCLVNKIQPIGVRIGEHDLTKECDCLDGQCAPLPQTIGVEEVIPHEFYNANTLDNDIGLVRLADVAKLNPAVSVVCMPDDSPFFIGYYKRKDLTGLNATVVGWGKSNFFWDDFSIAGALTSELKKVEIPIVDKNSCQRQFPKYIIDHRRICAGARGADSCRGDSGGPLVMRISPNQPWYLIGLVSFGRKACGGDAPGIYTDVEHYLPWIRSHLRP